MANPPDNKNPGNNKPGIPKVTPETRPTDLDLNSDNRLNTSNQSADSRPTLNNPLTDRTTPVRNTLTGDDATPPPLPKTETVQVRGSTTPVPPKTSTPPVPADRRASDLTSGASTTSDTTTSTSRPTTTGTHTGAAVPGEPVRRPATSAPARTNSAADTTSKLERPRPAGTPEPGPRRPNQLTRPARPLEKGTAENAIVGGAAADRPTRNARPDTQRPAGNARPEQGRRPPSNRRPPAPRGAPRGPSDRPLAARGDRPPAYRDGPRRRMAPPPGAKRGRYVAPAARPARRAAAVATRPNEGSALAPLLFGILLLAGVLWYAIKHYVPMIKADLETRTNSALATAGYNETANVEIDGRNAILKGTVASDADSESAEELVANTTGVRSVDNQLIIDAPAEEAPVEETPVAEAPAESVEPSLYFAATADGVVLSGTVADQDFANQITETANEAYGEDRVSGSITVDPNSTNPEWWPAVETLMPEVAALQNGSLSVNEGILELTGTATSEQIKTDLGAQATELVEGNLQVENGIVVAIPEPEPLQPAYANYYNAGDSIELTGAMPSASAETLVGAFESAGIAVQNNINVSDEFEAPAWVDTFGDSLAAMQAIKEAEVELQPDGDVIIYGIAESEEAKQTAADNISAIFTDQNLNNQISVSVPVPEPVVPSMQPFATVSDNGSTVTIAGLLSPAASVAITSSLEANGRTVVNNATADERVMEPEWTDAIASTLQSMNGIENPQVMISASGDVTLSGLADNTDVSQQAVNAGFDAFGNSVSLLNEISVKGPDITELFSRIDLAAIRFRSGSAELDADSITTLDQVADALTQVPDASVAVSGHTDSTGSAARNLSLSGQRAERVRSYLIERGISGDRMTAEGFGSNQPIASNETVTGRALNRRIEFALTNGE